MAPKSVAFGNVGSDTTKSKTLTIKNSAKTGDLTGTVAGVPAPFTVTAGSGSFILYPGSSEPVTVEFAPALPPGKASATLVITNDPKQSSVSVALTGTGVPGTLSVPASLTFPTTAVEASTPKSLTIKNTGLGVLHGTVGASTGPFAITAGSGPFTLTDGATETVTIAFTPPAKGDATGILPITSDDPKHPSVNVKLKGTGN